MQLAQYLGLGAMLFSIGIYGVLTRRNGVMILMAIELILSAVNINVIAFGAYHGTETGQVLALFVIAIAAVEVAIGLAIILLIYRNRATADVATIDEMRG